MWSSRLTGLSQLPLLESSNTFLSAVLAELALAAFIRALRRRAHVGISLLLFIPFPLDDANTIVRKFLTIRKTLPTFFVAHEKPLSCKPGVITELNGTNFIVLVFNKKEKRANRYTCPPLAKPKPWTRL